MIHKIKVPHTNLVTRVHLRYNPKLGVEKHSSVIQNLGDMRITVNFRSTRLYRETLY